MTPTLEEGPSFDPGRVLEGLAGTSDPGLFGVRHHSSTCAAAIETWLDTFRPTHVLLELPPEFADWLPWLGHPAARAPLALGAVVGSAVSFYPFADFSPELRVVRWCLARGIRCEPFDLPLHLRTSGVAGRDAAVAPADEVVRPGVLDLGSAVHLTVDASDGEDGWDRLVEAPGLGTDAEAVRRAALLYGYVLRADLRHPPRGSDLVREAYMRGAIRRARVPGARLAAVVGAFHGAGLLDDATLDPLPRVSEPVHSSAAGTVTSLLPYGFEQLDSRSGYPAGIRDPQWHQRVLESSLAGGSADDVARDVIVEICRELRAQRHLAGTPDATEALRLARGLAALRGLRAPGRREVLEGLQSALSQGEVLGRGRVVAQAVERVLVGRARGQLASGTPRSGLLPHIEALVAALRMPGPDDEGRDGRDPLRLDPLRSELDRRRHVALRRMVAANVLYGEERVGEDRVGEDRALTAVWVVSWSASTEATATAAGLRGVTLDQAASGALAATLLELERDDRLTAGMWLDVLGTAAEAGLHTEVRRAFDAVRTTVVTEAGLTELVRAVGLVERIAAGHVPGCPVSPDRVAADEPGAVPTLPVAALRCDELRDDLVAACVRGVDGLAGATDDATASALAALTRVFEESPDRLGDGRLLLALHTLAASAGPLMRGASRAALAALETARRPDGTDWEEMGREVGSWVDACSDAAARTELGLRLRGAVIVAAPQFEAHPGLLGPLLERVSALPDDGFLARLPALREGFDGLSPAGRNRLFEVVRQHLGDHATDGSGDGLELDADPLVLAAWAAADAAAMALLSAVPSVAPPDETTTPNGGPPAEPAPPSQWPTAPGARLGGTDRWRLVLGTGRKKLPPEGRRYARALDELYGRGRGEGSRGEVGPGAGDGDPYPSVREWGEDLSELFGTTVREEVLGRAAGKGDANALLLLNPDEITPSIDLLEQVLSLKGGLAEANLEQLRRICDRVVRALVEALAVRVRPALAGLSLPRPTRRPTRRLDLPRTVRANLATARQAAEGFTLAPDRFVFRTRGRKSMDWRVILVVDTSGSMDANVIHSAMMAAILSALPAVDVRFLAFSTKVVDLSERADDPLALLMEVRVGGGTHIGKAIRYARGLVTVPSRTLLCVVSDFEEGGPVPVLLSEVRTLAEAGVKMLGLAALDDRARPNYNVAVAERLVTAGMPVAALSPVELARWVAEQIR